MLQTMSSRKRLSEKLPSRSAPCTQMGINARCVAAAARLLLSVGRRAASYNKYQASVGSFNRGFFLLDRTASIVKNATAAQMKLKQIKCAVVRVSP